MTLTGGADPAFAINSVRGRTAVTPEFTLQRSRMRMFLLLIVIVAPATSLCATAVDCPGKSIRARRSRSVRQTGLRG